MMQATITCLCIQEGSNNVYRKTHGFSRMHILENNDINNLSHISI